MKRLLRTKWGIAPALTVAMVLVFAALIATTTALDVRRERAMFTEEMETRGLILSAALSEVLGNYLYVSDVDRIRDITKVVASDPKVHFVRVYRPDGRIVADTGQGAGYPTGAATSESGRRALEGRETVFQMNGGILEVSAPIVAGKQVLGGVVLGFSQASVESEIGAIALERIWQSLGLILAAALVALLITYYVARPIRRLVAATRNVARGQFDFSPQDSWVREISELTESFEKMTHALGTARSELETRVEQRTAELKESERSLVEARNRLRTVVENLPVATFAVDGDGVFTLSEGKGLEALGRAPSQVVGKSIFDVYRDVPAIAENIRAALSGEKRSFTVQIGDVVYDSRYEPVLDPDGRPDGVVGVALDITSLKLALDTLRSLARQLLNVQEKERGHIARELHDEIGQELTGLKFFLETASRSSDGDGQRALEQGQHLLFRLMGKVHDLSLSLRPSMLDDMGLPSALRSLIRRFSSQSGIQVRFEHSGPDDRMDPEVETTAYRVVQEALTNASRHADTDDVLVHVQVGDGGLEILIADEGGGFDVEAALTGSSSFGLHGMRERLELLGGALSVESAPGEGTMVKAELPLRKPVEVSLS